MVARGRARLDYGCARSRLNNSFLLPGTDLFSIFPFYLNQFIHQSAMTARFFIHTWNELLVLISSFHFNNLIFFHEAFSQKKIKKIIIEAKFFLQIQFYKQKDFKFFCQKIFNRKKKKYCKKFLIKTCVKRHRSK